MTPGKWAGRTVLHGLGERRDWAKEQRRVSASLEDGHVQTFATGRCCRPVTCVSRLWGPSAPPGCAQLSPDGLGCSQGRGRQGRAG